jgi:hypothetical protein
MGKMGFSLFSLTSFLAQWIGALILKNKWIILKAKTGMDGSDAENKK